MLSQSTHNPSYERLATRMDFRGVREGAVTPSAKVRGVRAALYKTLQPLPCSRQAAAAAATTFFSFCSLGHGVSTSRGLWLEVVIEKELAAGVGGMLSFCFSGLAKY